MGFLHRGDKKCIQKYERQTTFLWFSVRRRSILQDQAPVSEARPDTQKKTPAIPAPAQKGAATGPWSKAALFPFSSGVVSGAAGRKRRKVAEITMMTRCTPDEVGGIRPRA